MKIRKLPSVVGNSTFLFLFSPLVFRMRKMVIFITRRKKEDILLRVYMTEEQGKKEKEEEKEEQGRGRRREGEGGGEEKAYKTRNLPPLLSH